MKLEDFLIYEIQSSSRKLLLMLISLLDSNFSMEEFCSFKEEHDLYQAWIKLPMDTFNLSSPSLFKGIFCNYGEMVLKFSEPHVIKGISYIKIYTNCVCITFVVWNLINQLDNIIEYVIQFNNYFVYYI